MTRIKRQGLRGKFSQWSITIGHLLIILLLIASPFTLSLAFAQVNIGNEFQVAPGKPIPFSTMGDFLSIIYKLLIIIAIFWAAVHMIFGAIGFITAGGDPKAIQEAQGKITRAVVGLIILIVAYWIGVIIQTVTGIPIKR